MKRLAYAGAILVPIVPFLVFVPIEFKIVVTQNDAQQFLGHRWWKWHFFAVGVEVIEVGDGTVDSLVMGYVKVEPCCQCAVLWKGGFFYVRDDVFGVFVQNLF